MRYAITTNTYHYERTRALVDWVREFADCGFDAMSFTPKDTLELVPQERRDLAAVIRERNLLTTIHGNCDLTREQLESILPVFGETLYSITLDGARAQVPQGGGPQGLVFDGPKIRKTLSMVEECTRGTAARFGIEDLPLDGGALESYHGHLSPFLGNPRYGMLVDVGHMNLRIHNDPDHKGLTPEDCIRCIPVPILEVHLHDNAGEGDRHGHFGIGDVCFEAVADGLHAAGFEGISTIEICPVFHGSTPEKSKPFAKESLEKWRSLWEARGPQAGTAHA